MSYLILVLVIISSLETASAATKPPAGKATQRTVRSSVVTPANEGIASLPSRAYQQSVLMLKRNKLAETKILEDKKKKIKQL